MCQDLKQAVTAEIGPNWTLTGPEPEGESSAFLKAVHDAGSTLALEENGDEIGVIITHNSGRQEYISVPSEGAAESILHIAQEYHAAYEVDSQSNAEDRYYAVINPDGLHPITFLRDGGDDMVYYRATYAAIAAIRSRHHHGIENIQVGELSQEIIGDFSGSEHKESSTTTQNPD